MTKADMRACKQVADRHNEVIIFRSTGPWSKRWIEKGYPTKNFHVKGKSSDWGPQAGLVPYDGYFSKVGPHHKLPISSNWNEHSDMGNLTSRLLRCITALNAAMGATGDKASRRRVHHNAESHRNYRFGAITGDEMEGGNEGFPLTVFQPLALYAGKGAGLPTARYNDICTLETFAEFKDYAAALHTAGFYVPKNWVWNMPSIWAGKKAEFAGGKFE